MPLKRSLQRKPPLDATQPMRIRGSNLVEHVEEWRQVQVVAIPGGELQRWNRGQLGVLVVMQKGATVPQVSVFIEGRVATDAEVEEVWGRFAPQGIPFMPYVVIEMKGEEP